CPNRTWLIRDDSSNLEVLEYHNNLQITETPENNYYNLLTVEGCDIDIDQKTYVPILPGYSIITNIGGSYICFTIKKNEQNLLYFAWYDYGNDSTLTSEEHSYSGTHFFNTFNDYIQKKRKGKWSTPNLLGLNIKENVEFLRNKICHHYPSIFNDCKQIQTATKKTNTLINAMKRKGDQLIKEIESGVENDNNINENQTNIKEGIIIKSKGINVTPTEAQAALCQIQGERSGSDGWLAKFKNRHHIKQYFKSGEANSAPLETLGNERKLLKEVIQDYESCDVYNVDETALYWNLEPSKTLSDHFISGTKKSKDRVTIVLTCNADGSDKLTPLFIHKWQTPRVLRGIKKDDLPVWYFWNKTAWMQASIWKQYLFKLNQIMRSILLLADNAPTHLLNEDIFILR
ncbi:1556_t:CDS:2, partial [Entrophospora sp. SA101]